MRISHNILWIIFLSCITGIATAQDVIVKKDNSTILSKVLEISSTEIKYKKWSNQDGPTYSISLSDVSSINYQNGEVEKFSSNTAYQTSSKPQQQSQSLYKGYMDDEGTWGQLRINGRVLSDEEVRSLVSFQNYQLYLKAKRQNTTGIVFGVIGAVSLSVGGLLLRLDDDSYKYLTAAGTFVVISAVTLPTGLIFGVASGNKMKRIAQDYNKKQGKSYSFNIAPSILQHENLQFANDYGLGLTLSMNF